MKNTTRSSKPSSGRKYGSNRAQEGTRTEKRESRATAWNKEKKTAKPVRKSGKEAAADSREGIRLNKYIANSGLCSRREADTYISTGLVSINDKIITELGTKVYPDDIVKFNGETIRNEEKVYIVMNKPKDFVTTVSDPHAKDTVVGLVKNKCSARVRLSASRGWPPLARLKLVHSSEAQSTTFAIGYIRRISAVCSSNGRKSKVRISSV